MAFDIKTAKPIKSQKFDISTAKPFSDEDIKTDDISEQPLQKFGRMVSEAGKRTFQAGPTSFLNLTGGLQTQFPHDVKSVIGKELGLDPSAAESLAGATDPQSIMGGLVFTSPILSKAMSQLSKRQLGKSQSLTKRLLKPEIKEFASD